MVGSLVLGVHHSTVVLQMIGEVGSGSTRRKLADLDLLLRPDPRPNRPFDNLIFAGYSRSVRWVEPIQRDRSSEGRATGTVRGEGSGPPHPEPGRDRAVDLTAGWQLAETRSPGVG